MQALIQNGLIERGLAADRPEALTFARDELCASDSQLEEFFGHGPLLAPLNDPAVTEILVNGFAEIWVEKSGRLERTDLKFSGEESLRRYVRRQLVERGRKVDQLSPFADCTLPGGHRLHVACEPVTKNGVVLSIRKVPMRGLALSDLVANGALREQDKNLLKDAVHARKNIFICGGTGAGKTTLLGALVDEASCAERVIFLEDVAEIRASHSHVVRLECRPASLEGAPELGLRRLLKESLRMRPDRIVIGECRGPEAIDLLLALTSGHEGSMGTIHAGSAREALRRLETLALLGAENVAAQAVRNLIASAVHIVVCLARDDGRRFVASIDELKGVDGDLYLLKNLGGAQVR